MLVVVLLLGIVEGLTEFLPVSSTGHLILVGNWLGYRGAHASIFEVVIQLGAILAVVIEYRAKLFAIVLQPGKSSSQRLLLNLIVGFLPAAALGLLFHDTIKAKLFGPRPVALALIVGAVAMLVVERLRRSERTRSIDEIRVPQALAIGIAQCLALFPGFSRAAATILGGLVFGLDRATAAEYSFLLAIPTLVGAAALDLIKGLHGLERTELEWMGLGLVVSFLSAWIALRWFLRYVSHHSLDVFAWYRIALGVAVLFLVRG